MNRKKGIEEEKGYFKLTVTPMKTPKNPILNWIFWEGYWRVWMVWRINLLAWIFGKLAGIFESKE